MEKYNETQLRKTQNGLEQSKNEKSYGLARAQVYLARGRNYSYMDRKLVLMHETCPQHKRMGIARMK